MLSGTEEWEVRENTAEGLARLTVRVKESSEESACHFEVVFLYAADWPPAIRIGLTRSSFRIVPGQWKVLKKRCVAHIAEIVSQGDHENLAWSLLEVLREDFLELLQSFRKDLRAQPSDGEDAEDDEDSFQYTTPDVSTSTLSLHPHLTPRQRAASLNPSPEVSIPIQPTHNTLLASPKAEDKLRSDNDTAMKTALYNLRTKRSENTSPPPQTKIEAKRCESDTLSSPLTPSKKNKAIFQKDLDQSSQEEHLSSPVSRSGSSPAKRGSIEHDAISTNATTETESSSSEEEEEEEDDEEEDDTTQADSASTSSSDSSDAEDSDTEDSSSSSGLFARLTNRKPAEKTKKKTKAKPTQCLLAQPLSSEDEIQSPPRKPRVTTLTPTDKRQQIALRLLLDMSEVDSMVKDSVVGVLESYDVLNPSVFIDENSTCSADTSFKSNLKKLIVSDTAHHGRTNQQSSRFGRSWYREQLVTIKTLGQGGQGRVEQVQNKLDGMYYAVKRVELPQFAVPPEGETGAPSGGVKKKQKRFERYRYVIAEIRTLARLGHPYIVRYFVAWFEEEKILKGKNRDVSNKVVVTSYDCGEDDSDEHSQHDDDYVTKTVCFIQMEYCYQDTLRQVIDRGVFVANAKGAECGYKILWQLLQCVSYIHEQDVIHRDLKPENIFFDLVAPTGGEYYAGDIKVGDFGLATDQSSTSPDPNTDTETKYDVHHSSGIGTPLYCAPEQEKGGQYTNSVDTYSVGIIAYEMFSGFTTSSERIRSILDIRRTGKIPDNWVGTSINKNLALIVENLVKINPEERMTAADVLETEWLPRPHRHKDMLSAVQLFVDEKQKMSKLLHERYLNDPNTLNSCDWLYQDPHLKGRVRSKHQRDFRDSLLSGAEYKTYAKDVFSENFKRMGVTEVDVPAMLPSNTIIKNQPGMTCLDEAGNLFMIPKNPSVCFARYLSRPQTTQIPLPLRRYGVHKVPISVTENVEVVSFDVVTASPSTNEAVDAEMIFTLTSVLGQFTPPPSCHWLISVNHTDLLSVVQTVCQEDQKGDCAPYGIDEIMAEFKLHHNRVAEFGESLGLAGLAARIVELLSVKKKLGVGGRSSEATSSVFLQTAGRLGVKSALQRLMEKSNKPAKNSNRSASHKGLLANLESGMQRIAEDAAVSALHQLHRLEVALMDLDCMKNQITIEFDMTYCKDHTIYSGLLWGVTLVGQETPRRRELSLFGCGGRYTRLLQELRAHYERISLIDKEEMAKYDHIFQLPHTTTVSGGSLSITSLSAACSQVAHVKRKCCPVDEGSVFVCMDPAMYDCVLLLCIATELRESGLCADYQLDPAASVSAAQEICRQNGVTWVLIPTGKNIATATKTGSKVKFKLRNLTAGVLRKDKKGKENEKELMFEAPISGVARQVTNYLKERKLSDPAAGGNQGAVNGSVGLASVALDKGESKDLAMKFYTAEGKTHQDPTQMSSLVDTTFRSFPPSKICISTPLTIPQVREVVSLIQTTTHILLGDSRQRQLATQLSGRAAKEPMILVHSEPDMQFEVFVCSNLKVGPWESSHQREGRIEKGGKRKEKREGKNRKVLQYL